MRNSRQQNENDPAVKNTHCGSRAHKRLNFQATWSAFRFKSDERTDKNFRCRRKMHKNFSVILRPPQAVEESELPEILRFAQDDNGDRGNPANELKDKG